LLVGDLLILRNQAFLVGLAPNGGEIEAAAVIANVDDDLGAFAFDLQHDFAGFWLVALLAHGGRLDPVRHRVAQQVLERR